MNDIGGNNDGHDDEVKGAPSATAAGKVQRVTPDRIFHPPWLEGR